MLAAQRGELLPVKLRTMCRETGLAVRELHGSAPVFASRAFWTMVTTGTVPRDFRFQFVSSTVIAYTGFASKD